MHYESLLRATLIPTILLFILSLISTTLTTHYWILGDWIVVRGVEAPRGVDFAALGWPVNVIMIEYISSATDATIISVCLGLLAGVVAFIAWYKLRRADMDMEHQLPRRRFWVGFVFLTSVACMGAALAAFALHYTKKGPDERGCWSDSDGVGGAIFYCTREMGACNALPLIRGIIQKGGEDMDKPWGIKLICNETQAVKWLQIVIAANCALICAAFGTQAWIRRKTRYERVGNGKEPMRSDSPASH